MLKLMMREPKPHNWGISKVLNKEKRNTEIGNRLLVRYQLEAILNKEHHSRRRHVDPLGVTKLGPQAPQRSAVYA